MRLAVISDIHSNMDGLTAVLSDIEAQQADRIVSLGDNIGYGPEPETVIQTLQRLKIPSVRGNHEQALTDPAALMRFNPNARKALGINKSLLTRASLEQISRYKPVMAAGGACFVHGLPPDRIDVYVSRTSRDELSRILSRLEDRIFFVGHTHALAIYESGPRGVRCKKFRGKRVFLAKTAKYIINSGSVGQPRGSHNKATYVIWDTSRGHIESRTVSYDARRTARLIRRAGIPGIYAELLVKKTPEHPEPNK